MLLRQRRGRISFDCQDVNHVSHCCLAQDVGFELTIKPISEEEKIDSSAEAER